MAIMSRALVPLSPCILRRAKLHDRRVAFIRTTAISLNIPAQSEINGSSLSSRYNSSPTAVVTWAEPGDRLRASATAERFGLPLVARTALLEKDSDILSQPVDFALQYAGPTEEAPLELHGLPLPGSRGRSSKNDETNESGSHSKRKGQTRAKRERSSPQTQIGPLAVDFVALRDGRGSQSSGGSELVVKACKGKKGGLGVVWDLTAGLGRDATLLALASTGGVVMFERSVVMSALLDDALRRLAIDEGFNQVEESVMSRGEDEGTRVDEQSSQGVESTCGNEIKSGEDAFFKAASSRGNRETARISGFDLSRRLHLVAGDAISLLAAGPTNGQKLVSSRTLASLPTPASESKASADEPWRNQRPDVVYLDPMFPPRQKSALVKGEMQLLHRLLHPRTAAPAPLSSSSEVDSVTVNEELLHSNSAAIVNDVGIAADLDPNAAGEVSNEEEDAAESEGSALLKCGLAWATKRTVVKRPKNAPPLGGQKPSHSVKGSVSRFDVYVAPGAPKSNGS